MTSNGELIIRQARTSDSGVFTCRAKNNAGQIEHRVKLSVEEGECGCGSVFEEKVLKFCLKFF